MDSLIAKLETLSQRATRGPWQVDGVRQTQCKLGPDSRFHGVGPDGDSVAMVFYDMKTGRGFIDAKLIVELVNGLPEIIAALKLAKIQEG